MPELHHPRPKRASYYEILVHGYGNGTNVTTAPPIEESARKSSTDSLSSSTEDVSSRWSESSDEAKEPVSPTTSISSNNSWRGSAAAESNTRKSIKDFLDRPMSTLGMRRVPSSIYSASVYGGGSICVSGGDLTLQPDPLHVRKGSEDLYMTVTKAVTVQWEDGVNGEPNDELKAYLNA
jgi:hypothetical protein